MFLSLRSMTILGALFMSGSLSFAAHDSGATLSDPGQMVTSAKPKELEGVGITQQLGKKLDLGLKFKNEKGEDVTLGSFFGKNPVILSPVYYSCPGLCNFHLNGLTDALKGMDWSAGTKFDVVAISFDPRETPQVAAQKKASYMKVYDRPGTENGWHFLTADAETIKKLTESIGFTYKWNEEEKEWAHASAAIISSTDGTITRYLPGIMFEPKDVRLALVEAGEGKVGTFVDQLVLYCFQYNPHSSQYVLYAFNVMKLGGLVMMILLGLWLLPFWIRHRRKNEARSS